MRIRNEKETVSYEEAVSYIEEIPKFTTKPTLSHTRLLLSALGSPQEGMKVIHVAGTNGKGSVCSFLDSILRASGQRTGLFTSPHLQRVNERMRVDGRDISDDEFASVFQTVMDALKEPLSRGVAHPTYFEILFLMAVVYFRQKGVEWCVLETGMGGRLDMTNVIDRPMMTVITSISLDHTEYLGDTIEQIAAEKAGIIKLGVPVVYDAHRADASAVILARAKELAAPEFPVHPDELSLLACGDTGLRFSWRGREYHIRSGARYQMMNAALAVCAAALLGKQKKCDVTARSIAEGLGRSVWPCRMEHFPGGIILDGAHNEDGMESFIRTAVDFHEKGSVTILFSAVSDKDYPAMIARIASEIKPEHVVTTCVRGSRRVDPNRLADLFEEQGCPDVTAQESVEKAFRIAYSKKGNGTLFCVGSLYLAGEVRSLLTGA
jgi:dihydrofolate synthase/folylpolyglutamate synthase